MRVGRLGRQFALDGDERGVVRRGVAHGGGTGLAKRQRMGARAVRRVGGEGVDRSGRIESDEKTTAGSRAGHGHRRPDDAVGAAVCGDADNAFVVGGWLLLHYGPRARVPSCCKDSAEVGCTCSPYGL